MTEEAPTSSLQKIPFFRLLFPLSYENLNEMSLGRFSLLANSVGLLLSQLKRSYRFHGHKCPLSTSPIYFVIALMFGISAKEFEVVKNKWLISSCWPDWRILRDRFGLRMSVWSTSGGLASPPEKYTFFWKHAINNVSFIF